MVVYSVYLGDVFLKSFKSEYEAFILLTNLQFFLIRHDMEMDMASTKKEVI